MKAWQRLLFVALALVPTSVLASPPAAAPGHDASHDGGIVWITPIFGNTGKTGLLWILINFVVLMWILEKLLFSKLRVRTAAKHDTIKGELDKATLARKEAEGVLADVKAKLAGLDAESKELEADARSRAEADRKRIIEAAEKEAERIRTAAMASAEREADVRRRQLESELVDRAIARAEELLRKHFNQSDQARMVDEYVAQVGTALAQDKTTRPGASS
jgi:F0F1-type ATP synthase membrane subunit b/b'